MASIKKDSEHKAHAKIASDNKEVAKLVASNNSKINSNGTLVSIGIIILALAVASIGVLFIPETEEDKWLNTKQTEESASTSASKTQK